MNELRRLVRALRRQLEELRVKDRRLRDVVACQAKDRALWDLDATGPRSRLQEQLRLLHRVIGGDG